MLPAETQARILGEGDVLGLKMSVGGGRRTFFFLAESAEGPNDLADYSLGAASAQAIAGTGWQEITDSNGRYHLEPESEKVIYQGFFGITPQQAWVYQRYPTNRDLNSLLGTRAIGSGVGHLDGWKTPYRAPTPVSEFFTMKEMHPSWLGYAPYGDPSSITVRLYFYVTRLDVKFLGVDPSGGEEDKSRVIAPADMRARAKLRMVGGHLSLDIPSWVETAMRKGA